MGSYGTESIQFFFRHFAWNPAWNRITRYLWPKVRLSSCIRHFLADLDASKSLLQSRQEAKCNAFPSISGWPVRVPQYCPILRQLSAGKTSYKGLYMYRLLQSKMVCIESNGLFFWTGDAAKRFSVSLDANIMVRFWKTNWFGLCGFVKQSSVEHRKL